MKLAKIVNNKFVAIVEQDVADDRKDDQGNLIYRPIIEETVDVPDNHAVVGKDFIVKADQVIQRPAFQKMTTEQVRQKKLENFYTDPERPTFEERLSALEAGDAETIKNNIQKLQELRKKHQVQ